jgi:hypothetical protein
VNDLAVRTANLSAKLNHTISTFRGMEPRLSRKIASYYSARIVAVQQQIDVDIEDLVKNYTTFDLEQFTNESIAASFVISKAYGLVTAGKALCNAINETIIQLDTELENPKLVGEYCFYYTCHY